MLGDLVLELDLCLSSPCSNSSTCISIIGGYRCLCDFGKTGKNCDVNIDDCFNNTCKNGATCVDGVGKFTCTCPPGGRYTGPFCDGMSVNVKYLDFLKALYLMPTAVAFYDFSFINGTFLRSYLLLISKTV